MWTPRRWSACGPWAMCSRRLFPCASFAILAIAAGCGTPDAGPAAEESAVAGEVEATSFLGEPLRRAQLTPETGARLEENLAAAQREHEANPEAEESFIWHGRRLGYLGRYREAVQMFTDGLEVHPASFRLLRHRGHRYITLRRLDAAVADLSRAAELIGGLPDEVEPDGAPNRFNIPRSTTHSNIYYHLGLALYLQGEMERAAEIYHRAMEVSRVNDDMLCATSHWYYMTLQRLGRDAEAAMLLEPIREEMDVLENEGYHQLLLLYRGLRDPAALLAQAEEDGVGFASVGYGVGNWYRLRGDADAARELFRRIVAAGTWPAFGHIAAEAELAAAVLPNAATPGPQTQSRRAAGEPDLSDEVRGLQIFKVAAPEDGLLTAGQLTREQMAGLSEMGYRLFINLRTPGEKSVSIWSGSGSLKQVSQQSRTPSSSRSPRKSASMQERKTQSPTMGGPKGTLSGGFCTHTPPRKMQALWGSEASQRNPCKGPPTQRAPVSSTMVALTRASPFQQTSTSQGTRRSPHP